jgi:hypothetical protein
MKKKVIFFSLVLYGDNYLKKFFNVAIKTIINDLFNLKKKFEIKFLITTTNSNQKTIKKKLNKIIEADIIFFEINKSHDKYKVATVAQLSHINHLTKNRKNKDNYLVFLYADMLFSKNAFNNCIKIFKKKNIKVICSFGLLLNEKNKIFKKFLKLLINDKKNHLKLLIRNKDIIHDYHKQFLNNNINLSRAFLYDIINNSIYIKSFHYHPIIIKLDKINYNFKNVITLDNYFLEDNYKKNNIFVENNLNNISIFSFDKDRKEKIFYFHVDDIYKNYILRLLLICSYLEKSSLEKKLFINNTLTNDKKILENINFKKNRFNKFPYESVKYNKIINKLKENYDSSLLLKMRAHILHLIFIIFLRSRSIIYKTWFYNSIKKFSKKMLRKYIKKKIYFGENYQTFSFLEAYIKNKLLRIKIRNYINKIKFFY